MTFDQLIFAGKIKKKNTRVQIFLWGKQKAPITKSRRTHQLHKISSKTLTFETIYHFRVDSYHTSQTFFLIFLFFLQSGDDEPRLVFTTLWLSRALSCGEKSRKTSVTRVITHQQKKDLFLNAPASSQLLQFQQNRTKPQVIRFVFSYLVQL